MARAVIEKLEIERCYWLEQGVDWGIVTEKDIPPVAVRNIAWVHSYGALSHISQPYPEYFEELAGHVLRELPARPSCSLRQFCADMDEGFSLERGTPLMLVRHLLARKKLRFPMDEPLDNSVPLERFRVSGMERLRSAGMKDIAVNQVLEYPADGLVERVLWIDPANRGFYAIDINAPRALPVFRTMEDMERLREAEVWRHAANDPWLRPVFEDAIPASHRARRDQGWHMIKPLVQDQPGIFAENKRGRAIAKAMADTGATNQTLYRLLRRYWQRGLTIFNHLRAGPLLKDLLALAQLAVAECG